MVEQGSDYDGAVHGNVWINDVLSKERFRMTFNNPFA